METLTNALAILFILHFCWSYYWNCFRRGYTMDVWHFSLANMVFIIHFMLPFARSRLNFIAIGGLVTRTEAYANEAYLISALGYACVLVGGSFWRLNLGLGTRRYFAEVLELPSRGSLMLLRSKSLLLAHGILAITILGGVVLYYFSLSGFGFNLRGLLLTYPALRPIAQFSAFYSVLIGSHCLARFTVSKESSMLIIVGMIAALLLFFGERTNLLALAFLTIIVGMVKLGRRLKIIYFVGGIATIFVALFLLDALRDINFTFQGAITKFGVELFYGNSFSDTRDFALVLSFWDGHYFHGLTYLAGLLAFIPRALSSFRDTWAIGVVTTTMAGYDPTQHSGLRVGTFGEAFFNFGLTGVVLVGLLVGVSIRFVDLRMKQALKVLSPSSAKVYAYYMILTFLTVVQTSVVASAIYSILAIFIGSWMFLKIANVLKLSDAGN